MKTKILIIKLGYSETLDEKIGNVPSLGDILRTTPILTILKEKYPESEITWLVSQKGFELLESNYLIDRILVWDEFTPFQLMREKFDLLINLEKISGVCALTDFINSWSKYGFRFDTETGTYSAYEKSVSMLDYIKRKQIDKNAKDYWQKILIEMLGGNWKGQKYILGYKPDNTEIYDIGLNYKVGDKWPTKIMPENLWKKLETELLKLDLKVSWQKGLNNLKEYMDWINSCRIIITHDSLGLHLAYALEKNIIGLFGPTDPQEIYDYGKSIILHPESACNLMPCYSSKCLTEIKCMEKISIKKIKDSVEKILNK